MPMACAKSDRRHCQTVSNLIKMFSPLTKPSSIGTFCSSNEPSQFWDPPLMHKHIREPVDGTLGAGIASVSTSCREQMRHGLA
jgi:hypothetical protein